MATFNAKSFEKKLNAMDLSQTSVQTVSLWIIHHRQNIKEILATWIDMLKKAKTDRRLVLFYLANDVVQNSRKKSKEMIQYFGKAFRETLPYLNDKKINSQVERVLKIWEERRVYEKEFVDKLRTLHSNGKKEKAKSSESAKPVEKVAEKPVKDKEKDKLKIKVTVKPVPSDFKMSTVMNMIVSMKELESEISMQDSQMSAVKVDASDLEAVKQVKDRSGVNKFVKEFEESKEKLDVYCNKLSKCINDKRVLIDMLHHSESYYDAAYEEAKVIVHAYKTFGSRLSSMKRKVESKVKKLKVQWEEKQKEIEEKKSKPEYELEPISDAEEPSEFQPIGDLVQSGLKSLAAKKTAKGVAVDPTVDNIDVLDMDLGSESEDETPDGPLYDPSSVMYDPNDAGKDAIDNLQSTETGDNSNASQINIPNPEDVFKNIVGQDESSTASLFKPMGILIDGKLQTVSLSDGNMIVGREDQNQKSIISVGSTSNLQKTKSDRSSSVVATEPSGSLLNDDAMSPISEDSVPSPEGTPEGLVLDQEQSQQQNLLLNSLNIQPQGNITNLLPSSSAFPSIMQSGQFVASDQFSLVGSNDWNAITTTAPLHLDQVQLGGLSDLPPPPMLQGFPGLPNPTGQLTFEQPVQGFVGDQLQLGSAMGQLQQGGNLLDQFQLGGTGMQMGQQDVSMQLQMSGGTVPQILNVSSTTPTQDESAEQVRPIDILSQLLSKGRKSKKDRHAEKSEKPERDRSTDHDREHRSKDHKHRKGSSNKRRSTDRHHSSDAPSEHGDSSHSSSKRSHHRRKSRGHSREKHSHSEDRSERREDSVDTFDDNSEDSFLKSPKVSRLQSVTESVNDADESRNSEDVIERQIREPIDEALENKSASVYDRRRAEREQSQDTTVTSTSESSRINREESVQSNLSALEAGKSVSRADLSTQYSTDSDIFLQQQKSLEGPVAQSMTDFQFNQQVSNPQISVASAEQWFQPTTPQKQASFFYNDQRSPTPEMDKFQNSSPMDQAQQPFIASSLQQFVPVSMPQFDIQQTSFSNEANLTPQIAVDLRPNITPALDVRPNFPHNFQLEQQREQGMQPGTFEIQPLFNQQPSVQPEGPFLRENRPDFQQQLTQQEQDQMIARERMVAYPPDQQVGQDENVTVSSGSSRFRPVEASVVPNMRFVRPDNMMQREGGAHMPPSSPYSPDHLHLPDNSFARPETQFFRHQRPGNRPERPQLYQERGLNFRGGRPLHSPFGGNADFSEQKGDIRPDFQECQRFEDFSQEGNELSNQPGKGSRVERRGSDGHGSYQDFAGSQRMDHVNSHDFAVGDERKMAADGEMPLNGNMQGYGEEQGEYMNNFRPEQIRQGGPRLGPMHQSQPIRNRFRHQGPNAQARGPWPFRPNRPAGFQQQRSRFRPPLRPRLPPGFVPRRPVF